MGTGKEMNTLLLTRQAWGSGNLQRDEHVIVNKTGMGDGDWQRDEHITVNKTGMGEWELAER